MKHLLLFLPICLFVSLFYRALGACRVRPAIGPGLKLFATLTLITLLIALVLHYVPVMAEN